MSATQNTVNFYLPMKMHVCNDQKTIESFNSILDIH